MHCGVLEMTEDALRDLVARLGEIDRSQLISTTPLSGRLGGSLGRARLDSVLRSEFGVSAPEIYRAKTFGDLCAALGDGTAQPVLATAPVAPPSSNALTDKGRISVGVDVEAVAAMPLTSDYREDSFYHETFTPREISYALLQPNPRATFAGMWCAKEALRKADPGAAGSSWKNLEVVHDETGKPGLIVVGKPVPGDLSLSHSEETAIAVYVEARLSTLRPTSPDVLSDLPVTPVSARTGRQALVIALLALAFSITTTVLVLLHR